MAAKLDSKISSLYQPLEPNQVRLLQLNPDANAIDLGGFKVVDLCDTPPYYALSHSWTSQDRYTNVSVGGYPLTLATDLVACVKRLSQLWHKKTDLKPHVQYAWIDSICIDQSNLAERSAQVALMGRLYRGSIRTLIWLGDDDDNCFEAWTLLDHIYTICRQQNPTVSDPSDIPARIFLQSAHDASGLPAWDDQKWTHLARLMQRRWFSRIWVVQEVALSRLDPVVLHGDHCYPWSRIGWAAAWFRKNGYMRLPQIPEMLRNVYSMTPLRQAGELWPLDALVAMTQIKFNATDQRDKIYGLLGLAREFQDPFDLPDELQPDYTIDMAELCPKMARFMLGRSRSLALLTRARGLGGTISRKQRAQDLDLPSWCPDWSDLVIPNEGIATSLSWVDWKERSKPARFGFLKQFSASAGIELDMEDHVEDPRTLALRGIRVSEVENVTPFAVNLSRKTEPEEPFTAQMIQILSQALRLLRRHSSCHTGIEPVPIEGR
ncbi:hypothetical protein GGTG_01037 [Gaeumannomyces tritici R3-111a-1]|uniref:Heterokaryon incompatibility domain-containing protein n=1 Tax=Gaeumannomyces tritici (strain R3-111a-1) TaxID=644352 RepID=J3NIF6_GAET3|nr:hypothetical protein GGTG_01037 [Gaeumannomyces tritici R3-111a-1]EJT81049.1 hypothetical protein GGTG_01037 [Gaeumannomyces tritici R3-111a-1]